MLSPPKLTKPWASSWSFFYVNLLPYYAYILSPIPNVSSPYRFVHFIFPFCMGFHCKCPTCLLFLNDILNVMHANPIPTSSCKIYVPIGSNQYYNNNFSLSVHLNFFIMVKFPLILSGSLPQN